MNYITVRGVAIGLGIPKICVPVTETSGKDIVKQAGAAAPKADLIEWRADAFEDVFSKASVNHVLKELRTAVGQRPLLFTFRTEAEGGAKIDVDDYIALGEAAVESGCVDLIDVEMDRGRKLSCGSLIKPMKGEFLSLAPTTTFQKRRQRKRCFPALRRPQGGRGYFKAGGHARGYERCSPPFIGDL